MIDFIPTAKFDKDASVILLDENQLKRKIVPIKSEDIKKKILALSKLDQFSAKSSQIYPLVINDKPILLVGLGNKKDLSLTTLRKTIKQALSSSFIKKAKTVEIITAEENIDFLKAIVEGVCLGTYQWKKYISKDKDDDTPDTKSYFITSKKKKSLESTETICEGTNLTRDLVNDNADITTSTFIEKTIQSLIKGNKKISVETLNSKELKAKGLNLHIAVNKGSNKEPKLIIVNYNGAAKTAPYTAIIGKGLTFDSGGLNLKPSGHIEDMKIDMSGAATVIGILKNTISLNIKKNILFVCAMAENAIGSNSYKPGDIFKSYEGKTVEIGNTDAEGRLVLADAIAYTVKNYKPAKLIDLATLTGACIMALGYNHTGLVSNDDAFANKILKCAKDTDDWAWRLPLYPELKDMMKSKIADLKNISNIRGGGTVTAAEFLRNFIGDTKWVHLDIAGTAYTEGSGRLYFNYGATGSCVRLLTQYLQNH